MRPTQGIWLNWLPLHTSYSHNGRTERAKPQTGGDGTLENPFTCLDALNYTKELPADQTSTESFYIKGKVVSIRETFGTRV